MAEFISTFITGFKDVVCEDFPRRISSVKILGVYDGLIHYQFNGNSRDLEKIIYFNNTFFVLKTFKGKNLGFPFIVNSVCAEKKYFLINKGSFRVRFSKENQFAKVDKNLTRKTEEWILRNSKLKIDRLSPTSEVWFLIRNEGFAFCGQLIFKREFTEKNLNKGELRPEIASLICSFANVQNDDDILEPFCGYGAIPAALSKHFSFNTLTASDIDKEKIDMLVQKKILQKENIKVHKEDAFTLESIADKSISLVITDPPWGFYEEIDDIYEFYEKMFDSFTRILKEGGRVVILSARKAELEKAAADKGYKISKSLHTLVNGKKAGVYEMCL